MSGTMNDEIKILQTQLLAHQVVLRVLMLKATETTREEIRLIADDYEDVTLSVPIPDAHRDLFSQTLRKLSNPSA